MHSPETLGASSLEVAGKTAQKLSRFRGSQRWTQEISLYQRAVFFLQEQQLSEVLYAFCHHFQLERLRHSNYRRRNYAIFAIVLNAPDE
jgi:hypothetical protein